MLVKLEIPNPQGPPPSVPIPGELDTMDEEQSFKCGICGNVYNSKEELKVHLDLEHDSEEKKSKKT